MDKYSKTLEKIYHLRGGMIDLRLDRMDRALALFDHPEKQFLSLHIAGTNGKGSTSAMLHAILSQAGYCTALYTSPHLVSFTERIRIGTENIGADEVVSLSEEIWQAIEKADVPLTFFEFVTAMAFIYFARRQVDIAIVEVGLGGRLDATNVINPLACAITTVSKDHEAYLGPDELSIGQEKGGIIKPGIPVACGKVSPAVAALLKTLARERGAPAYFLGADFGFSLKNDGRFDYTGLKHHYSNMELALRGQHQRANASVALALLEFVSDRFRVGEEALRRGLRTVRWPGRLETVIERPTVILDGAHNTEGVKALIDEIKAFRPGRKIKLLFATMADKEWRLMLRALATTVDEIVFTRVQMERSADPDQLAQSLSEPIPNRTITDSRAALQTLLGEAAAEDVVLVAGSLYLLGEIRPMLLDIAGGADSGKTITPYN